MLVKLTPVINFINILRKNFSYERCFGSFFYVHVTRKKLPKQHTYKKFVNKLLMKLTKGSNTVQLTYFYTHLEIKLMSTMSNDTYKNKQPWYWNCLNLILLKNSSKRSSRAWYAINSWDLSEFICHDLSKPKILKMVSQNVLIWSKEVQAKFS